MPSRGTAFPSTTGLPPVAGKVSDGASVMVPNARDRYLAEIAETVRAYHERTSDQVATVQRSEAVAETMAFALERGVEVAGLDKLNREASAAVDLEARRMLENWPQTVRDYSGAEIELSANGAIRTRALAQISPSGTRVPRVALPRYTGRAELLRWLRSENLPGRFPFTAGVFPFKREEEQPTRMFAGEGDPFRTNRRFHLLARDQPTTRLSTAFDPVTLYGFDPDERPDIYGKIGTSGVSVATLDDMKALFDGFDLCDPSTSVSMTINGPAPAILAMFLNTAIDQRLERFADEHGRPPSAEEAAEVRAFVLTNVRGTVQADILKEDQGQNTCIFSTEFSLRVMGDIQEYFVHNCVRNFYSVSISGYHIAEAGANPITQLAFTLANAFTYVEAYLARGMQIDDFAPNLSFFFSNGMDPEYSVIGRVARRIWAIAMRDRYRGNERSQKLKYHIQTSGRSLHAQEMAFNDIRTTLQALCAVYDNANSLHTNAFDEAVTTPTPGSVRRALAIQLVINRSGAWPPTKTRCRAASSSKNSPPWWRKPSSQNSNGSPNVAAFSARWKPATSAAASRMIRCSTNSASTTGRCRSSASTPSSTLRGAILRTTSSSPARAKRKNAGNSAASASSRVVIVPSGRPPWPPFSGACFRAGTSSRS